MLSVTDLVALPYTPDLTQGGIAYACRSLPYTYDRMGGSTFDRLRRIVAGVSVELALRRYLISEGVSFDVLGATPFTEPDRYDLALGGRRCDIKSFLLFHKQRIRAVRQAPERLLEAPALVPLDQLSSEGWRYEDLYVFAFVSALITPDDETLQRAEAAEQPTFIMHTMPREWSRPPHWETLSPVAIKADLDQPLTVELGGQKAARQFHTVTFELAPRQRVRVPDAFHSLSYLRVDRQPEGRLGVSSPRQGKPYLVPVEAWSNIWVYGLDITLAGYINCGEFRRRAKRVRAGSKVLQYPRTRVDNMAVPVGELHPMSDLVLRARNWSREK